MKDVICEETARFCLQVYHDRLRALILTGSLARNEGTFVKDDLGCLLLGDAEFLLVFAEHDSLPTDGDLRLVQEKIDERVRRRGLRAEITLTAVHPDYLRELPPSIFAYELRIFGEAVAGDPDVLTLIPKITRADIPLEDAWRILANRLVEQLEGVDELLEGRPTLSPLAHYRTVKLYLDMTTSLLVFVGGYAPTYAERAKNLSLLVERPEQTASWPFRLRPFTDDVMVCTQWKLSAIGPVLDADRTLWEQAITYAQALWHWELARLVGSDPNAPSHQLMARWMARQPLHERLRGWAHVVRKHRWLQSWQLWPRWLRLASHGSPRHLVYKVASTLMFELGSAAGSPRQMADLRHLGQELPVTGWGGQHEAYSLGSLARVALGNYKRFLMETRA